MGIIEVTVSSLQNAAAKVAQANETFRDAAVALKNAADELSNTWEGPSHDIFVQEHEEIDKWYQMMADLVDEYVVSMQNAAQQYDETDKAAAAYIRKA